MKKWKLLDKKLLIDTPMFDMYRYHLLHSEKKTEHNFFIIETYDWVKVIPITKKGEIVLIRQYRAGSDSISLEIPGGVMDLETSPIIAAKRELEEETGYINGTYEVLGHAFPNPAFLKNKIYFVLAKDVEPLGHTNFDPSEYIEKELIPLSQIPELINKGKIRHALTITAFVYLAINGCCEFNFKI